MFPSSSHWIIIIPTLLLHPFLLLWVQTILQQHHRIFSRLQPGSLRILLASKVRVYRMRMHGWSWCISILFLWLALCHKRLHTPPHSYAMLHRSGGLVIRGGIMGITPMIGMLWRKPFCSDLAWTFVRRRCKPDCCTSRRVADWCMSIWLGSSCAWAVLRATMNVASFGNLFGSWINLWWKPWPSNTRRRSMLRLAMVRPSSLLNLCPRDLEEHLFHDAVHSLVVEEWMQRGVEGVQPTEFWIHGQRGGFWVVQTMRSGRHVGPHGTRMVRGRGFP